MGTVRRGEETKSSNSSRRCARTGDTQRPDAATSKSLRFAPEKLGRPQHGRRRNTRARNQGRTPLLPLHPAAASQALPATASRTLQALPLPRQWEGMEGIPSKNLTMHSLGHNVPAPRGKQPTKHSATTLDRAEYPAPATGTGQSSHSHRLLGIPRREGPRPSSRGTR